MTEMDYYQAYQSGLKTMGDIDQEMNNIFGSNSKLAMILIKSQIPMYTGELNPRWKFWDDMIQYDCNHLKTSKEKELCHSCGKDVSKEPVRWGFCYGCYEY